ncbi:MAG TPA: hypothetical protein VGK49_12290 [Ilumatobacteraceae bacterium]
MKLTGIATYRQGVQPGDARVLGAVRPSVRERFAATSGASRCDHATGRRANPAVTVNPTTAIAPTAIQLGTTGVFVAMWQSTKCTTRHLGAAT